MRGHVVALVLVFFVAGCTGAPPADAPPDATSEATEWTVTVESVTDGDTMEVRFADGTVETVRLLGVDTPESTVTQVSPDEWESIPDTVEGRDWLANWAGRATGYARSELAGETVTIRVDPEADRRGYYGRLLVYIYTDQSNVAFNRKLLERGYARYYDSTFSNADTYQATETTARTDGTGVWGYGTGIPDGGTVDGVVVERVHADAEGNDNENLNDEYVVFANRNDTALALGGWTVSDEVGHTYRIPDGVTLEPGATLTLHTGDGPDSESDLYWGANSAIWNNGGDTVIVRDANGAVVIEHPY